MQPFNRDFEPVGFSHIEDHNDDKILCLTAMVLLHKLFCILRRSTQAKELVKMQKSL
jgi:hypothetical protein